MTLHGSNMCSENMERQWGSESAEDAPQHHHTKLVANMPTNQDTDK